MSRILVIDDEPQILRALATNLRARDFTVDLAHSGREGLQSAADHRPDLVIVDLGLPDLDGVEVVAGLRGWTNIPIIVLSVRDAESDKVAALDAGADDYLTKPFALDELLARVRALHRRSSRRADLEADEAPLTFADLTLDPVTRDVTRGERKLSLTRTEFALLELFLRRPKRVLERSFILEEVWGFDFPTTANSLEVYVGYVRRKLEAEGEDRLLHTVRGVGYVLRETPP